MLNIGITFVRSQQKSSLWTSGVNQNAIFLVKLFRNMGHNAFLIHIEKDDEKISELFGFPENIKLVKWKDFLEQKSDIVIQLGFFMNKSQWDKYKSKFPNTKLIAYVCGSIFNIETERIIHKPITEYIPTPRNEYSTYDQIWIIPQMEKTSINFAKYQYKCEKATVVPFVWDPVVTKKFMKELKLKEYDGREIKNLAVMEPNLSVQKHFLLPLITCEKYLVEGGDFEHLYLMDTYRFSKDPTFVTLIDDRKISKLKKVTAEPRFPTIQFLNLAADLVFSFQWEVPLNYLYLDVAWWGWPIVHNAEFCQDIGYYYQGWDTDDAVKQLDKAIKGHHTDTKYKRKMRKNIFRYTCGNPKLMDDYQILLDDVVNDRFKKWTYDWKTNTIS